MEANELEVTIHTDGACSGNPGPGGHAGDRGSERADALARDALEIGRRSALAGTA